MKDQPRACPRAWEVRAVDEGRLGPADAAAFHRHARTCAACKADHASYEELRDLGRQLEVPGPSELELRRLRGLVLRDAMRDATGEPSRPGWRLATAGLALGVAASAAWLVAGRRAPEPFAADVTAKPIASFTQSRAAGSERVVLTDGDIALRVRKQAPGERFVVALPDGEVEVRGTTFEVSVHGGRTDRVHVETGVVVVRVRGESVLSAGDTWPVAPAVVVGPEPPQAAASAAPPVSAEPAPPPPEVRSAPPPAATAAASVARGEPSRGVARSQGRPARVPAAIPRVGEGDGEGEMEEYERAIDSYRLGRFDRAAELLHAFAAAHPTSSLTDDALFIEATSLASAGHTEQAGRVAREHARRFPGSFHRKETAVLVARAARDAGDCAAARAAVEPWRGSGVTEPAIATALGRCDDAR